MSYKHLRASSASTDPKRSPTWKSSKLIRASKCQQWHAMAVSFSCTSRCCWPRDTTRPHGARFFKPSASSSTSHTSPSKSTSQQIQQRYPKKCPCSTSTSFFSCESQSHQCPFHQLQLSFSSSSALLGLNFSWAPNAWAGFGCACCGDGSFRTSLNVDGLGGGGKNLGRVSLPDGNFGGGVANAVASDGSSLWSDSWFQGWRKMHGLGWATQRAALPELRLCKVPSLVHRRSLPLSIIKNDVPSPKKTWRIHLDLSSSWTGPSHPRCSGNIYLQNLPPYLGSIEDTPQLPGTVVKKVTWKTALILDPLPRPVRPTGTALSHWQHHKRCSGGPTLGGFGSASNVTIPGETFCAWPFTSFSCGLTGFSGGFSGVCRLVSLVMKVVWLAKAELASSHHLQSTPHKTQVRQVQGFLLCNTSKEPWTKWTIVWTI